MSTPESDSLQQQSFINNWFSSELWSENPVFEGKEELQES